MAKKAKKKGRKTKVSRVARRTRTVNQTKKAKQKPSVRLILALIFGLISMAFLIIEAIYLIVSRTKLLEGLAASPEFLQIPGALQMASTIFTIVIIVWFVLAVLMGLVIYLIEKNKAKWYWLLILSIVSIITMRFDTAIFGIIASILYAKKKK